jgi:regulator of nucleoside diphosphate kinase
MATQLAVRGPDPRLIARRWAILNQASQITLGDGEVHYLTAMALAVDDDLVAHLLLAKLRIAARAGDADDVNLPAAWMNSLIQYGNGGETRWGRLVHPTAAPATADGISITSLVGAGLIGLREGQSIDGPDADGASRRLKILRVAGRDGGDTIQRIRK